MKFKNWNEVDEVCDCCKQVTKEAKGITKLDIEEIQQYFKRLNKDIPEEYIEKHDKTAHLMFVKLATQQSLNLGVCASVVMYDRHSKLAR